jgi:hypothetical protein
MPESEKSSKHAWGKHRYTSVVEGCAMAAQYRRSGLTIGEFVRQTGVSRRMVLYWTQRERELAANVQAGFVEVTAAVPALAAEVAAPDLRPDLPAEPVRPALPNVEPSSWAVMVPVPSPVGMKAEPLASPAPSPSAVEIRLPGGATIAVGPGFDPQMLRAVVGCLVAPC